MFAVADILTWYQAVMAFGVIIMVILALELYTNESRRKPAGCLEDEYQRMSSNWRGKDTDNNTPTFKLVVVVEADLFEGHQSHWKGS